MDSASGELLRRSVGQRGDGRRRCGGRATAERQSSDDGPSGREPIAARLDRCAWYRHPAVVAAARPDRAVGAAAVLGTREPGPDRAWLAAGRRGGPVSGAAGWDLGCGQFAPATLL